MARTNLKTLLRVTEFFTNLSTCSMVPSKEGVVGSHEKNLEHGHQSFAGRLHCKRPRRSTRQQYLKEACGVASVAPHCVSVRMVKVSVESSPCELLVLSFELMKAGAMNSRIARHNLRFSRAGKITNSQSPSIFHEDLTKSP